jgi:parallel beta-helix repeat protein
MPAVPLLLRLFAVVALSCAAFARFQGASTPLPQDAALRVSESIRLPKGVHVRAPREIEPNGPQALVWARGLRNAVIDLGQSMLVSANVDQPQDLRSGFAVHLEDCENVTLRGGTIRGFKAGVVARNCRGLKLEQLRFEDNFAQRLSSTAAAPDPADELARRDNELGEWLANYGAAIFLVDCSSASVTDCRARRGQNGLVLERCTGARVRDNDFSFLSGWGIALYRSSENKLVGNRCDFCVRGYSHGVYGAGLGSAGILLSERCVDNTIAYNLGRGCGDGVSLLAGRDVTEGLAAVRGELAAPGCDRNLIYRNDLSGAVSSGIAIEFSRENRVIENVADDCLEYGLRGAYAQRLLAVENSFSAARKSGLCIEHGQEAWIARNVLERCATGLELYWDEDPELVGGPFGRARDTSSRDHWIWGNAFGANSADLRLRSTTGVCFAQNVFEPKESELISTDVVLAPGESTARPVRELLRGVGEFLPSGSLVNVSLRTPPELPPQEFGTLELVTLLEAPARPHPRASAALRQDSIHVGEWGPWDFESSDPKPAARPIGGLFAGKTWEVAWVSWKDGADPRAMTSQVWRDQARDSARLRAKVDALGDPWAGRPDVREQVGETHLGLVATTKVRLAAGRYLLRVVSDDGVRVRVGSQRVVENWTWHDRTVDEVLLELAAGEHEFQVDYFQVDGGAVLSLDLIAR